MTEDYDLIVIGSGPGGAFLACGRYQAAETWIKADGSTFSPQLHYFVGGNSKVYGSARLRLRERNFDEIVHAGGISPAWPLKYDDFSSYYDAAEELFHVHGARGEDPTEPPSAKAYAYPPVRHEPKVLTAPQGTRHSPIAVLK